MRLRDWEPRLAAHLDGVIDRPHAYGTHDCVLHGTAAAEAVIGVDHAAAFRGRYTTELGAARALRRAGFASVEAAFDHHFEAIEPAFAQRGDLVLVDGSIGVCVGGVAIFAGPTGQSRIPRARWTKAWRVD